MKRITSIILSLTLLISCNNTKKTEEEGLGSTNENSNFIEYYNAFLEVDKEVSKTTKKHIYWIGEDYAELKGGKHYKTLPITIFGVGSSYKKSENLVKSGLKVKVEQQELINVNVKKYFAAITTLFNKREEFALYTKAEDYKTDSWKKGDEIVLAMKSACQEIYAAKEVISPIMNNIAEKAEIEFINKDPDKDFILAMKQSMKKLDEFYNELITASENKGKSNIDSVYFDLEKEFEILKKADASKIKDASRKSNYESYVKKYEATLAVCRKINNRIKDKKPDYKDLADDFNSEYSSQVTHYNYFIN